MQINDNGPNPNVLNIEEATVENTNYRTTVWTGENLQVTVMSIKPGEDVGLEVHHGIDQFLRIEAGEATVEMGDAEDDLKSWQAKDDFAVMVPAGKWHNLTNTGKGDLKLYSIYAKPEHPHGTVHVTREEAEAAEAAEHGH